MLFINPVTCNKQSFRRSTVAFGAFLRVRGYCDLSRLTQGGEPFCPAERPLTRGSAHNQDAETMIQRQCPECGSELMLTRRADNQDSPFNSHRRLYLLAVRCLRAGAAEQLRKNKRAKVAAPNRHRRPYSGCVWVRSARAACSRTGQLFQFIGHINGPPTEDLVISTVSPAISVAIATGAGFVT